MDNSEKGSSPESDNNMDLDEDTKRPHVWGPFYLIIGIIGLAVSLYSGYYDFENIVPLFGTIVAGILIAALSILMIVYGYRIMKRDI